MADTITGKPVDVKIENPDQASTNFYWTSIAGFNLQTTIRGILNVDQIKAHVQSAMEATAYVLEMGGLAKQVGKSAYETPASPLPSNAVVTTVPMGSAETAPIPNFPTEPQYVPVSQPETPAQPTNFISEKLAVTISNNKKYIKVKGGPWVKYGVTVWDEVLAKAGINVNQLEAKEYDFKGYKATYVLKADGKPDKVVSLEKVA